MDEEQHKAIIAYTKEEGKETAISYNSMNAILRDKSYRPGEGVEPEYDEKTKLMTNAHLTKDNFKSVEKALSALQSTRLKEDLVFRRGTNFSSLVRFLGIKPTGSVEGDMKLIREKLSDINSGSYMGQDRAFLSTSPLHDGGFPAGGFSGKSNGVEYVIQGHKGDEALYLDPYSACKGEGETLFQAGTKFRIVKVCPPEEGREITVKRGNTTGHWKVYMETIPGVEPVRGNP